MYQGLLEQYKAYLPITENTPMISLAEGNTPLIPLPNLSKELGTAGGIFIYVGLEPLTEPFINSGITNPAGWVETDTEMKTSIPGVFAIGDVRNKDLRQITTAVGEGGIAGQQVYKYIEENT